MATDLNTLTDAQLGEGYSDAYKDINGFRPSWPVSRERLLAFWASYDDEIAIVIADNRRQLEATGFATWEAYYADKEEAYYAESVAWREAQAAEAAHRDAFLTKGHPLPVVEAWEHGAI